MSLHYLDKLQFDLSDEIDVVLAHKRENAARGMLYSKQFDDIAVAMHDGLKKDAQRYQNSISMSNNLNGVAIGIIRVADKLDELGEEIAVAHLEDALENLVEAGASGHKIELKASVNNVTTVEDVGVILTVAADELDNMGYGNIVDHIDAAIASLNKVCDCGGSCCS